MPKSDPNTRVENLLVDRDLFAQRTHNLETNKAFVCIIRGGRARQERRHTVNP